MINKIGKSEVDDYAEKYKTQVARNKSQEISIKT